MKRIIISSIITVLVTSAILYASTFVKIEPMTLAVKSTNISVGVTATALPTTNLVGREVIAIRNNEATTKTMYIGASDVSTTNGFPLDITCPSTVIEIDSSVTIYGITGSSTVDCRVLEAK